MTAGLCRFTQVYTGLHSGLRRYTQVYTGLHRYTQVYPGANIKLVPDPPPQRSMVQTLE